MSDIAIKIRSSLEGSGLADARKAIEALARAAQSIGTAKTPTTKYDQVAAQAQRAAQAVAGMSKADVQAAKTAEQLAQAQNRTAQTAATATAAEARAEKAIRSLAQAQEKAAQGAKGNSDYFSQMAGAFSSGIAGMVGPAAAATAALGALKAAGDSFKEAFTFKAQLDENTASIAAQLRGVRESGQVFSEARAFADRYKLTQAEMSTAIQASVPLLRQSKASLTDVLTVLAKLQVLKPEQGIEGAAFALAELQGGQTRSLATRFNIPIA
jgi:hypothetical protein